MKLFDGFLGWMLPFDIMASFARLELYHLLHGEHAATTKSESLPSRSQTAWCWYLTWASA